MGRTPIGTVLFLLRAVLVMILKTVFFTGNFVFKLDNNRNGTIRSAIFLLTFTIIHVAGNTWDFFTGGMTGQTQAVGESYFFFRQRFDHVWFGDNKTGHFSFVPSVKNPLSWIDASIIEIYLLLAAIVHVSVALKRSWDISINYCIYTGRWNMMLSGLCILTFMMKHLSDFRFYPEDKYKLTLIHPAPMGVNALNPAGILKGHMWTMPSEAEGVVVADLYVRQNEVFKDTGNLVFYVLGVCCFMFHMIKGWEKVHTADMLMIPKKHLPIVKYIGWVMAVAIGSMYLTVAIGTFLLPFDTCTQHCANHNPASCKWPQGCGAGK